MRQFLGSIICIILFWNCANNCNQNAVTDEYHKEKFDSFLTQFAQFDGKQPNESFFRQRKNFPNEIPIGHSMPFFFMARCVMMTQGTPTSNKTIKSGIRKMAPKNLTSNPATARTAAPCINDFLAILPPVTAVRECSSSFCQLQK